MDACLNKSTIGKDRYVCGVAFKDHTWCTYSMDATTDIEAQGCLLYTSPSPRDLSTSRMPSSA